MTNNFTSKRSKSRKATIKAAKNHAQVARVSRGGIVIRMEDLNRDSRGLNWVSMKGDGAKKLGMKNPFGKNSWFEHTDGHPDAGLPNIPKHHDSGHIHAISPNGEKIIFTW